MKIKISANTLWTIVFVFISSATSAQSPVCDSLPSHEIRALYNKIYINHLSYIAYTKMSEQREEIDKGIVGRLDFPRIPDSTEFIDLDFKKLNIAFKDSNYLLYEVTGFSMRVIRKYDTVNSKYPHTPYGYRFGSRKDKDVGLIAYDCTRKRILYLSGPFFTDDFTSLYLDGNPPEQQILDYVQLKYYEYFPSEVKILENAHGDIFCSFKSGATGGQVNLAIQHKPSYYKQQMRLLYSDR